MTRLSPQQIYSEDLAVGFTPAQASIMTAIAEAESGGDDTARGDLGLQNAMWGPSYGTYQVRTLKAATGTGQDRDISWLAASDLHQAQAAFDISGHGSNFSPWTTYTSGKYQQFLGQTQGLTGSPGGGTQASPVSLPGVDLVGGVRDIAVQALAAGLGLALVGVGLARMFAPQLRAAGRGAVKAGKVAAVLA